MRNGAMNFDLDREAGPFDAITFDDLDAVEVAFTIRGLGSANSHLDITAYLLDAAWAVEKLAAFAGGVRYRTEGYFNRRLVAVFHAPRSGFGQALEAVALRFDPGDDDPPPELWPRLDEIDLEIRQFGESIPDLKAKCPDLIDWYLADLVIGANYEWRSEDPDYVRHQFMHYPERRFGYFRSAHSNVLGAPCYGAQRGWLFSSDLDLDLVFAATGQKCRMAEFSPAVLVLAGDGAVLSAERQAVSFPMATFLEGSACADLAQRDPQDVDDEFDAPRTRHIIGLLEARVKAWLHTSGALALIEGERFHQLLSIEDGAICPADLDRRAKVMAGLQSRILGAGGLGQSIRCAWDTLDDDRFEELCYDVIRLHPKIETASVRKLGKSRSRDGGRDIEALEARNPSDGPPFKWIFQCKLVTKGRSLGASRLVDVGDMLDQYGAQGFGVMTSAPIDATLYDKLDMVCRKRGVLNRNYSVLELERELHARPSLRARYFG